MVRSRPSRYSLNSLPDWRVNRARLRASVFETVSRSLPALFRCSRKCVILLTKMWTDEIDKTNEVRK